MTFYGTFFFFLTHLRVGLIVELLCSDPATHQMIPHRVREREIIIPRRRDVPVFDQREVQVPVEALLELRHILHTDDPSDADLLAFLLVRQRRRHPEDHRLHRAQRTGVTSPIFYSGNRGRDRKFLPPSLIELFFNQGKYIAVFESMT